MYRSLLLLPLLCLSPVAGVPSAAGSSPGSPADTPAAPKAAAPPPGYHQTKLNGHTFTLPDGFTIELAAGPPLADRPIVAALDEKGRLYVCDSSGSNEKVAIQVEKKPHRIVRLEDTDGDGKYDKSTVYVPNVMFPEGAMWLNGSLYVAAVPHIWKFTDTDDDGKADKTEIWFDGTKVSPTVGGCANDLHGPYLGPDGWVYWCKGGFEKQEYTVNGKPFKSRAAHIFRARPDGSGIEPVMTGGMDNPVDVVFTPSGERIFSCTFLQHPANGRRDGLIHAVYGGVYGKDWAPVYEHPWTSPSLMPPMTHLGPAAPCGLHRYESDQFGKEYENNLFACQFNMHKVSRHVLVPTGSTFTTKDFDFVVSDQHDFHPTDVIEDADGSLLILDTGGWYKLCCPSSQLVKPDVKGAVYRVKKVGAHKVADPRGEKIEWKKAKPEELAKLLGDTRPVVRWKAVEMAAGKSEQSRAGLWSTIKEGSTTSRLHAVWAAARRTDEIGKAVIFLASRDADETVKLAAIHVLSLQHAQLSEPTAKDKPLRFSWLTANSSAVRRASAEAMGRHGSSDSVHEILAALADEKNDRVLDHSLTYALIEIADPKETAKGLTHKSPRVRRAVLTALDQMPGSNLDPKAVFAELDAKDAALRETAWWIAGRHPQWGSHLAGYFAGQLKWADQLTPPQRDELADRLVKFAKNDAVQQATAAALKDAPKDGKLLVLRVVARSGLKAMPGPWAKALLDTAPALADRDLLREALAALRAVPVSAAEYDQFAAALPRASLWPGGVVPEEFRLALLAARPPGAKLDDATAKYLAAKLGREEPAGLRSAAADVLGRAALTQSQFKTLAAALKTVGPVDAPKVIDLFGKSKDESVGLALVSALSDPKVLPAVRVEMVKPILDKYPPPVRTAAGELYAKLAAARKDETAKLERLVKELPAGDIRRGQAVFNGAKAQCAACHKIGYVGGLVGPDLTRIGGIRTERDLLESIVFPSASFVRSYEPVRVTTLDGRAFNGVLKKDAPDEIVLAVAADKEERVARGDIETLTPSTVSVMPAGLDQQLSPQELADLVAFLKASK